tara:strand:+ start:5722 stop:6567 length:846 start_codon:yes stop_codon:yes gene_type:complete
MIEPSLEFVCTKLSNGDFDKLDIKEELIESAVNEFRDALKRQLSKREEKFRLRMSNVGKPLCQLQKEKAGATRSSMPYNHWMRMMHGDISEILQTFLLRLSGVNITGGKSKVKLKLGEFVIEGEDDIQIDDKVYDIKSSAPWAFNQKWRKGFSALQKEDDFGYIPQLVGYAESQGKDAGGWIVMDKSSGEIKVVECDLTKEQKELVLKQIEKTAKALKNNEPFKRCFKPVDEYFRQKPTGKKTLPKTCTYCSYLSDCWKNAELRPQTLSQAQQPKMVWYVE